MVKGGDWCPRERSWVRIPVPHVKRIIFHIYLLCKKFALMFKKTENKHKEACNDQILTLIWGHCTNKQASKQGEQLLNKRQGRGVTGALDQIKLFFLWKKVFWKTCLAFFCCCLLSLYSENLTDDGREWQDWAVFESSWCKSFYQKWPKCMLNFWAKMKSNTFHVKQL